MPFLTDQNTPAEHAAAALESIRQERDAFDMHVWINSPLGPLRPQERPSECGTTLCAAGWIVHNAGWTIHLDGTCERDGVESNVEEVGTALLNGIPLRPDGSLALKDIPDDSPSWLFFTGNDQAERALEKIAAGQVPTWNDIDS